MSGSCESFVTKVFCIAGSDASNVKNRVAMGLARIFIEEGNSCAVFDCKGVSEMYKKLSTLAKIGECLCAEEITSYARDVVSGIPIISVDLNVDDISEIDGVMCKFEVCIFIITYCDASRLIDLRKKLPCILAMDVSKKIEWKDVEGFVSDLSDSPLGEPVALVHNGDDIMVGSKLSRRMNLPSWGSAHDLEHIMCRLKDRCEIPLRASSAHPSVDALHPLVDIILASLRGDSDFIMKGACDKRYLKQRVFLEMEKLGERLSEGDLCEVNDRVWNEIAGCGPIEVYMQDPDVSEIMVNGPGCVFIEKNGEIIKTQCVFRDRPHLMAVIDRLVSKTNRRIDELSPMVDARLADGSRLNAVIEPVSIDGPTMTIRKFVKRINSLNELVSQEMLPGEAASFLRAAVRARRSILISGGTGTGKTTLLGSLAREISEGERIITIEDSAELDIDNQNLVRLEARPENAESSGRISIRDLVRNALRMRPDRIIVGECRGAEALDMIQAMNTGHEGSMVTVHANSARDALLRLQTMLMMAETNLPVEAIEEQIARSIRIIVQLTRRANGNRIVSEVSEITGREGDTICMQGLWKYSMEEKSLVKTCMFPKCLSADYK